MTSPFDWPLSKAEKGRLLRQIESKEKEVLDAELSLDKNVIDSLQEETRRQRNYYKRRLSRYEDISSDMSGSVIEGMSDSVAVESSQAFGSPQVPSAPRQVPSSRKQARGKYVCRSMSASHVMTESDRKKFDAKVYAKSDAKPWIVSRCFLSQGGRDLSQEKSGLPQGRSLALSRSASRSRHDDFSMYPSDISEVRVVRSVGGSEPDMATSLQERNDSINNFDRSNYVANGHTFERSRSFSLSKKLTRSRGRSIGSIRKRCTGKNLRSFDTLSDGGKQRNSSNGSRRNRKPRSFYNSRATSQEADPASSRENQFPATSSSRENQFSSRENQFSSRENPSLRSDLKSIHSNEEKFLYLNSMEMLIKRPDCSPIPFKRVLRNGRSVLQHIDVSNEPLIVDGIEEKIDDTTPIAAKNALLNTHIKSPGPIINNNAFDTSAFPAFPPADEGGSGGAAGTNDLLVRVSSPPSKMNETPKSKDETKQVKPAQYFSLDDDSKCEIVIDESPLQSLNNSPRSMARRSFCREQEILNFELREEEFSRALRPQTLVLKDGFRQPTYYFVEEDNLNRVSANTTDSMGTFRDRGFTERRSMILGRDSSSSSTKFGIEKIEIETDVIRNPSSVAQGSKTSSSSESVAQRVDPTTCCATRSYPTCDPTCRRSVKVSLNPDESSCDTLYRSSSIAGHSSSTENPCIPNCTNPLSDNLSYDCANPLLGSKGPFGEDFVVRIFDVHRSQEENDAITSRIDVAYSLDHTFEDSNSPIQLDVENNQNVVNSHTNTFRFTNFRIPRFICRVRHIYHSDSRVRRIILVFTGITFFFLGMWCRSWSTADISYSLQLQTLGPQSRNLP